MAAAGQALRRLLVGLATEGASTGEGGSPSTGLCFGADTELATLNGLGGVCGEAVGADVDVGMKAPPGSPGCCGCMQSRR